MALYSLMALLWPYMALGALYGLGPLKGLIRHLEGLKGLIRPLKGTYIGGWGGESNREIVLVPDKIPKDT